MSNTCAFCSKPSVIVQLSATRDEMPLCNDHLDQYIHEIEAAITKPCDGAELLRYGYKTLEIARLLANKNL